MLNKTFNFILNKTFNFIVNKTFTFTPGIGHCQRNISCVSVPDGHESDNDESGSASGKKKVTFTPIKHEDLTGGATSHATCLYGSQAAGASGCVGLATTSMAYVPPHMAVDPARKPREQAKVSPYMATNIPHDVFSSHDGHNKFRVRSPKPEIRLPPLEIEVSTAAAQGKLAYVSPTVRSVANPIIKFSAQAASGGLVQAGHRHRPANLNFIQHHQTAASVNQLSPVQASVQIGQPVLLNSGSQVEIHRYVNQCVYF